MLANMSIFHAGGIYRQILVNAGKYWKLAFTTLAVRQNPTLSINLWTMSVIGGYIVDLVFTLYWLQFNSGLSLSSGVCVDRSAGISSTGRGLFLEGLLARHFSLWARSRGALALTAVLQSMQLALVLLSCSTTAKKFQMGSFCFMMNSSMILLWIVQILEVTITRNFLTSRVYQVWSHTITQALPMTPFYFHLDL